MANGTLEIALSSQHHQKNKYATEEGFLSLRWTVREKRKRSLQTARREKNLLLSYQNSSGCCLEQRP